MNRAWKEEFRRRMALADDRGDTMEVETAVMLRVADALLAVPDIPEPDKVFDPDDMHARQGLTRKARWNERKLVNARSQRIQDKMQAAYVRDGKPMLGDITRDALEIAENTVYKIDEAIAQLEHLRIETTLIAIGYRWNTTERPPQMGGIERDLGELKRALAMRVYIVHQEEARDEAAS